MGIYHTNLLFLTFYSTKYLYRTNNKNIKPNKKVCVFYQMTGKNNIKNTKLKTFLCILNNFLVRTLGFRDRNVLEAR